jgi:hypothetical protein
LTEVLYYCTFLTIARYYNNNKQLGYIRLRGYSPFPNKQAF